jgi:EGF-like domain
MGNDCSERICPFGKAHVDGYKGSLNSDGDLTDTGVVTQMYPKGAAEAPILSTAQSAHEYRECSNKGVCDRETGVCSCFDAYEGSACQRASCPNECSGHGVCQTVRELALGDYSNTYELWDADKGLACKCDAGYSGYDCSERSCPVGVDPLYSDVVPIGSEQYPTWAFIFQPQTGAGLVATSTTPVPSTTRFRFYDASGEDWLTGPVPFPLTKPNMESAFLNLPNDVVTAVTCTVGLPALYSAVAPTLPAIGTTVPQTVWCKFTSNPGAQRMPEIVLTDSAGRYTARSSLAAASAESPDLKAYVLDLGVASNVDYFGTYCAGVTITTSTATFGNTYAPVSVSVIGTVSDLQSCLGDSDGAAQAFGVQWDNGNSAADATGTMYPGQFPHLVKLVDNSNNNYNAILFYDSVALAWKLVNHVPSATYKVYATAGTLARTFQEKGVLPSTAMTLFSNTPDLMAAVTTTAFSNVVTANIDISCKTANAFISPAAAPGNQVQNCIEKGSLVVIPSTLLGNDPADGFTNNVGASGPLKPLTTLAGVNGQPATSLVDGNVYTLTANLYEVKSITSPATGGSVITLDRAVPFTTVVDPFTGRVDFTQPAPIFKFTPAPLNKGSYVYAGECSTRGLCNRETGICKCFKGYTNDNCNTQSALAM